MLTGGLVKNYRWGHNRVKNRLTLPMLLMLALGRKLWAGCRILRVGAVLSKGWSCVGVCRWVCMGALGCSLVACTIAPSAPSKPLPPVKPAAVKPKQPLTNKDIVAILLREAERALRQAHLTTPQHDNAYDRYLAVLQLDPGNPQAVGGVQLIGQRYLAMARSALAGSSIASAKGYLNLAQQVLGENSLVAQLRNQIRQTENTVQAPVQTVQDANVIALSARDLSRKDEAIKTKLAVVARQVRDTDRAILIVARSDAEGRWIYKQMRESVEGYRLRGDIKIGQQPLIRLLPPLDEGLPE